MAYARLTTANALPSREAEIERTLDEFLAWLQKQKGFIMGFRMVSCNDPSEICRLTVWHNRADADAVATTQHVLSVASHIIGATKDRSVKVQEYEIKGEILKPPRKAKPAT